LTAALSAATAAVAGVILNLGLWFAVQILFESVYRYEEFGTYILLPVVESLNVPALGITSVAGILYFGLNRESSGRWGLVSLSASRTISSCDVLLESDRVYDSTLVSFGSPTDTPTRTLSAGKPLCKTIE
jgi:hypothetical protein